MWCVHFIRLLFTNQENLSYSVRELRECGGLAGSVGRACDLIRSCEFKPHVQHRDYFKRKKGM